MNSNKTYIEVLIQTLNKKVQVLDEVITLTEKQKVMLMDMDIIEIDEFDRTIDEKEPLIEQINDLNDGFEKIYDRIKDEIKTKKLEYIEEIKQLQNLIKIVTDKSVLIRAMEKQNNVKFQYFFKTKSLEIKEFKQSTKTVSNYYKNMASQHQGQSYFIDKKK